MSYNGAVSGCDTVMPSSNRRWHMNKQQVPSELKNRLESVDPVNEEPMPLGWSRRNWVQREALAFAALGDTPTPRIEPAAE